MLQIAKTFFHIILWCGIGSALHVSAQQPSYTYYTLRDGLPSNDIYNCTEDRKGFLWVATENGLSKFDGKNFKNYSTTQGLSDNEILNVQMDSAGIIWGLPFQHNPVYYDEKADRFINSSTDPELKKITFGSVTYSNPLSGGGMGFCNNLGKIFIYKNKKCEVYDLSTGGVSGCTRIIELPGNKYLIVSRDSLRILFNGKIISKALLSRNVKRTAFMNSSLYIADSATLVKIPVFPDGSTGTQTENKLPFKISSLNFTGKQLAVTSGNGNIYLADTTTLAVSRESFSFNSLVKYVYEDRESNNWICTKENGLIRYQQKGILSLTEPAFQRNFSTVSFWNDKLAAGTNEGRIYFYNGPYSYQITSLSPDQSFTSWVRQTVSSKAGLLVGEEGGLYLIAPNYKVRELFSKEINIASKFFLLLNDSIIVTGNTGGVTVFDLVKARIKCAVKIRVTTLEATSLQNIYIGSNTGLYKWQNLNNLRYFGKKYPILTVRVSSLAYNKADNVLWVGPATDSLIAMYNDVPVGVIPLGARLPGNNCRALFCSKKGVVWVGTNLALGRIEYTITNNKLTYKLFVFTTADGLAGKQINDIAERNDTIYVATTSGISLLPASLQMNAPEIPVYVSGIRINNRDTLLQNAYELTYRQNSISVNFTAANIGATAERIYQYNVNDGPWTTTKSDNLELQQLSPGKYIVKMRVFKRDGTPSKKIAEVTFRIRTPFWQHWIFLIFIFLLCSGTAFYFLQKRSRILRIRSIQKLLTEKKLSDLELKALKAQINPHFVFNCLNSIKYLNYQKRFEETEHYLDKFSYLLRKTLDFSGLQKITLEDELRYSTNYLELEKLRLGDKMQYEVITAKNIDPAMLYVPPMLLQPYLENAVKHGIRHMCEETGKILIETEMYNGKLLCRITDNGIGIENSKKFADISEDADLPHGNTLQQRRATLYGVKVNIHQGQAGTGTIVTLEIETA